MVKQFYTLRLLLLVDFKEKLIIITKLPKVKLSMGNFTIQIFYRNKKGKYAVLKQNFSVEPFCR